MRREGSARCPRFLNRDGGHGRDHLRRDGSEVGCSVTAELTRTVLPPAARGRVVQKNAGVVPAGGNRDRFGRAEGDRGQSRNRFPRTIAVIGLRSLSELPRGVRSPAFHRAVVQEDAGVVVAGGHLKCRASGTEVDGGEEGPHRRQAPTHVGGVGSTELTVLILAPTLQRSIGQDGTRVGSTGRHLDRAGDEHRGE